MQKIAVVGFGAMGQMHSKCYQVIPKAKLVAIVDAHPAEALKKQKELGLDAQVYPSLDALLAEADVDVIDICLPTDLHVPLGLKAVAAGKHVFCEKPFAPTVADCKKLTEAARKKKVSLMVGHCIRFWPEYQFLKETIDGGKHGKLLSLSMQRTSSRPVYSKGNWLQNLKRSGGAVTDLHIHDTDFAQYLFGKPSAVTSVGTKDESGWSHVFTTYHYKKVAVTAEGGWNYPPEYGFKMAYQAVFENAVLEFDFTRQPTLRLVAGKKPAREIELKKPAATTTAGAVTGNISSLGGYLNELRYFVDRLEKKEPILISTGQQAALSIELIAAEIKSLESGKTVSLKKK